MSETFVHDAYVLGTGSLHASLAGSFHHGGFARYGVSSITG